MTKKIIFFDIDGTLLSETTKTIPESAVEAIHRAQKNGHLAVVNTGRTAVLLEKEILDIGFDGYICGCGTKIWYQGETLFHKSVDTAQVPHIVDVLRRCKIDGILEGDKNLFFDKKENMWTEEWTNFESRFDGIAKSWDSAKISMDKLYTLTNPQSSLEEFKQELGTIFDFIDRERGFYELVPKGCTKASGIKGLLDYLGMELKDTFSIGDSNNDLPMLDYTAVSIAMGAHSQGIHDRVDYITKTVEEDGIYHALSHYALI